jgi:hypothetical protein
MKNMPDPYDAKESIWLPFIKKDLGCDENTILIGHSSGAEATMRLLETEKVVGAVLVSPCVTDLGDEGERASGYYNRPWQWEKIRSNAEFIMQFSSPSDHLVPIAEGREVAKNLQPIFHELPNRGHFLDDEFPELVDELIKELKQRGYLV